MSPLFLALLLAISCSSMPKRHRYTSFKNFPVVGIKENHEEVIPVEIVEDMVELPFYIMLDDTPISTKILAKFVNKKVIDEIKVNLEKEAQKPNKINFITTLFPPLHSARFPFPSPFLHVRPRVLPRLRGLVEDIQNPIGN